MKKIIVFFFLFFVLDSFAIPNRENKNIEQEEQRKIYKDIIKNQNIKPNATFKKEFLNIYKDNNETRCFLVKSIQITGSSIFKNFDDITNRYKNTCIGLKSIKNIENAISNKYIKKGYITSRAYIKPQDLSKETLHISVLEGKIEKVKSNKISTSNLIFQYKNKLLDIKQLEVALQQAKRLQSQNVDLALIPGDKTGYSIVYIKDQQTRSPLLGNVNINNYGTKATGKYRLNGSFTYENPFNISDILSIGLNTTNKATNNKKHLLGGSFSYAVPLGRALWNFEYNYFKYKQIYKGENNEAFTTYGDTNDFKFGLDYKLSHAQSYNLNTFLYSKFKRNRNYFNDALIELQSYNLATLNLGISYNYFMKNSKLYTKIALVKGVNALNAKDSYAGQKSAFTKYVLDINYNQNILQKPNLSYSLSLRGQRSNDHLYGTEEISIGGVYSVRGFNNSGLSGNSGFYARNELSSQMRYINCIFSPYIGVDYGYIKKTKYSIYGHIIGGVVGLRSNYKNLNIDTHYSTTLKNNAFTEHKNSNFLGVQLSWNF